MGAAPSTFSPPLQRKRNSRLEKIQQKILDYLGSNDYCADPYKHFKEIASYGYETLEQFISEIPSSEVTDQILYHHVMFTPAPQLGMRYVVCTEPEKRGVLVEPIVMLQNGNFATLQMDSASANHSFIAKSVHILLYFFFPLRFVFQKVFGQNMLPAASQKCTFNFELLLPEKEHLLAYLLQNEPRTRENGALFPSAELIDEESDFMTSDDSSTEDESVIEVVPHRPFTHSQSQTRGAVDQNEEEVEEEERMTLIGTAKGEMGENEKQDKENIMSSSMRVPNIPQIEITFPKSGPTGTQKGIEGAHNSCYMDSLLFSMFYTTSTFDFLLQPKDTDTEFMKKTRKILKEKVVTPLREIYYCDYESLMDLRIHLSVKNQDLMGAFMDAEQVLYLLCEEVLNEKHFIHYAGVDDDGWGDFMHLMSIDASDPSKVISVQQNLKISFAINGNIKMANVPNPALILGMPRSNRELIHYEAVIPNPEISIENLLGISECYNCTGKADWEIQPFPGGNNSASAVAICSNCIASSESAISGQIVSRTTMRLHSVVCIRGVHFTAFVRSGEYHDSRENEDGKNTWYFFDSMAGGYPEVTIVPKLEKWLEEISNDPQTFFTRMNIPAVIRRCLTDGHLCIYQPVVYRG